MSKEEWNDESIKECEGGQLGFVDGDEMASAQAQPTGTSSASIGHSERGKERCSPKTHSPAFGPRCYVKLKHPMGRFLAMGTGHCPLAGQDTSKACHPHMNRLRAYETKV